MSDKFRLNASLMFEESCPEASRFFLQQYFTRLAPEKDAALDKTAVCDHCYQWRRPGNHRVRLRPKRRPSLRVQRVLRRRARGKTLSLAQRHLLNRFQKSTSVLMATCHACNKTSIHRGMNREFLSTWAKTHGTPGSAGKHKTPPSANRAAATAATTPKTPGKDKTPSRTPRSSMSSSTPGSASSSSKTPSKAKNWVVQRLGKILMREDKPSGKKGSLKDFLSSL
uniref:UPF0711 protein C18orf21 homolog n=1 Tax=Doryrhamphus excisus TaxID=161450 RepID=UPI0025ADE142|nr:UPF0711 protein C18orf21 homolog [Doryrhamphus excisus]